MASRHASVGFMPLRIISTIVCPPETLMFSSPFPVDPAPPTSPSTYSPAPIIGESPTRPGIFHDNPEVVVVPLTSPLAFTARQLIVPVTGCAIRSSAYAICSASPSNSCVMYSFHSGLSIPGRQLKLVFAFQASQIFRECSVSRFVSSKPSATPKRRAPSPTSITWFVRSITVFANRATFLIFFYFFLFFFARWPRSPPAASAHASRWRPVPPRPLHLAIPRSPRYRRLDCFL